MNWRPFDIKSFLKASKGWDAKIAELRAELDNMPVLPSVSNDSGVHSGGVSDMTASMALRRLKITSDIEELLLYKEMLGYALRMLTEDERALVDGFFFSAQRRSEFVRDYGQRRGICDSYVYQERDRVLRKMGEIILAKYYE